MVNCTRKTNENIRRVIVGQELTMPLKELDKSCDFKKKLLEFELAREESFVQRRKIRTELACIELKQKRKKHHDGQPWILFKKNCEDCNKPFKRTGKYQKLCEKCFNKTIYKKNAEQRRKYKLLKPGKLFVFA